MNTESGLLNTVDDADGGFVPVRKALVRSLSHENPLKMWTSLGLSSAQYIYIQGYIIYILNFDHSSKLLL